MPQGFGESWVSLCKAQKDRRSDRVNLGVKKGVSKLERDCREVPNWKGVGGTPKPRRVLEGVSGGGRPLRAYIFL